jgi:hypothetical protein
VCVSILYYLPQLVLQIQDLLGSANSLLFKRLFLRV